MYKVNDIVKYKHPMRGEEKGKILTKLKVVDDRDAGYIDKIVYIISYNKLCENDLVLEDLIIGLANKGELK